MEETLTVFEQLSGPAKYGNVYRASFRNQIVVVKVPKGINLAAKVISVTLCDEAILRKNIHINSIEREARTLQAVNHPNIPKFVGWFIYDGKPCLIAEFIVGQTLLSKMGVAPEKEVAAVLVDITKAVDYLHSLGIEHRDLHPGNMLVSEGKGYLLDLGQVAFDTNDFSFDLEKMKLLIASIMDTRGIRKVSRMGDYTKALQKKFSLSDTGSTAPVPTSFILLHVPKKYQDDDLDDDDFVEGVVGWQ